MTGQALTTLDGGRAVAYRAGDGYDYESAITGAANAWRARHRDALTFGLHLLAIKELEPHGQYLTALERLGVPDRTARRFVARAKFLCENNHRPALADLTGEQIDQLAKLPPMLRDKALTAEEPALIAGRPVAEVATLSTNQFRRLVLRHVDETPDAPKPARDPIAEAIAAVHALDDTQRAEFARRLSILPLLKRTPWAVTRREPM